MNKSEHHIKKLTPEIIEKYYQGTLSESKAYQVERLMLNSDFDNEAMEGFENYSGNILNDLERLNTQIEKRISEEKNDKKFLWLKIAASILILALSSYLVWDLSQNESVKPLSVAKNEVKENNVEDTIPTSKDSTQEERNMEDVTSSAEENSQPFAETPVIAEAKPEIVVEKLNKTEESSSGNGFENTDVLAYEPSKEEDLVIEAEIAADEDMMEEIVLSEEETSAAAKEVNADPAVSKQMSKRMSAKKSKLAEEAPAASSEVYTYSKVVTGKVTSAEDGTPLQGVNVILKGTTKGTVTDIDGNFRLQGIETSNSNTIVFNSIGLASEEIEIDSYSEIDLQMHADVQQLSEVVVTRSNTNNLGGIYKFAQPEIGMTPYKRYLIENIQYPQDTVVEAGNVIVTFNVMEDGNLKAFSIRRGISEWHNNEALRLIKEGPKWNPSINGGDPEVSRVKIVVKFNP